MKNRFVFLTSLKVITMWKMAAWPFQNKGMCLAIAIFATSTAPNTSKLLQWVTRTPIFITTIEYFEYHQSKLFNNTLNYCDFFFPTTYLNFILTRTSTKWFFSFQLEIQADEDHDSGTESDEEIDGPDLPPTGKSRCTSLSLYCVNKRDGIVRVSGGVKRGLTSYDILERLLSMEVALAVYWDAGTEPTNR